jgi:hypothetical protein
MADAAHRARISESEPLSQSCKTTIGSNGLEARIDGQVVADPDRDSHGNDEPKHPRTEDNAPRLLSHRIAARDARLSHV